MSNSARRRTLLPRETIGCVIQRRRIRTLPAHPAQRSRAALVYRRARVAAALRPGAAFRIYSHMLAQHELNLHLHFASGASAEHITRRLPTAMIFMRSSAARMSGAPLASPRALTSTVAATAQQRMRSMLLPNAPVQPAAQPAPATVRPPVLRHWLRRDEISELQTSRSRIERMHRLSVTRIRTSEQQSAGLAAAQPPGIRPRWLPTPVGAPLQPTQQHRLRPHRSQTVQTTTLAWSTAVERRRMSRAQSRTAPDERRVPSAAPLTWRKSASAGVDPVSTPPASAASPAAAVPSVLTTVHHSQPHQQRDSAPAVLSRAAIDRLAEDVMQRLERRVRIERERRGL